jgi:hypothetical protein
MENTPDIELFLEFEGENYPDSFSIKPTEPFKLIWTYCEKKGVNLEAIKVLSQGLMLTNQDINKTIQDLNILTNTVLRAQYKSPDDFLMNSKATKVIKATKTGEHRAKITRGLNLRGKCPNQQCESYKKQVVVPVGFEKCDVIDKLAESKCPICKEFFEPDTFIYFDCKYQVRGTYIDLTLKSNSKIRIEPNSWESTDSKKIHSFAPDGSRTKNWLELEILAKPLDEIA